MPQPQRTMEERFKEQFPDVVLGTLSGDKDSPVFVNNDLEIPRLLNFISSEIQAERERVVGGIKEYKIRNSGGTEEVYDDTLSEEEQRIDDLLDEICDDLLSKK